MTALTLVEREKQAISHAAGTRRVALVLQGGGALGAYQAGVFQALDENGFTPDWVGGTSIGAINGARQQRADLFARQHRRTLAARPCGRHSRDRAGGLDGSRRSPGRSLYEILHIVLRWIGKLVLCRRKRETCQGFATGACLLGKVGREGFYAAWETFARLPRRWLRRQCAGLAAMLRGRGGALVEEPVAEEWD